MTTLDITKLLSLIHGAYPYFTVNSAVEVVWQMGLGDLSMQDCETALGRWVHDSSKPPAISDIRHLVCDGEQVPALDAWGEVLTAITDYGYNRENEAMAAMSEGAAYVAQRMGWQSLCMSEVDMVSVIRGQFVKLYDARCADLKREAVQPAQPRTAIEGSHSLVKGATG